MIFDTDVLILLHRAHGPAVRFASRVQRRMVSIQTTMEFLQAAPDKRRQSELKQFLERQDFDMLPITEAISHRALGLIEAHSLGDGLRAGDALIAATAIELGEPLVTANQRHFKKLHGLELKDLGS